MDKHLQQIDKRFKVETVYTIDYNDFDNFISERFGKEYECVADNEWSNYESHDFDVTKLPDGNMDGYFMKYTVTKVKNWSLGENVSIDADSLLEYLVWKEELPLGKYLIRVFW